MASGGQIKSLNKSYSGPGTKRFVFKSFAQRVASVDVDVFRSLAPVKFEPTAGTSFFQENLLQWRELNTAADFNLLYGEVFPLVQSLPQLLLHKKTVVRALLARMHMGALLSLEPVLSLIAVLSRDLREDFLPFVPPFLGACLRLLEGGADREPDVLEQIFTSVSYVFKHLVKYLAKDLTQALKSTRLIRYHRRDYVRDFAAEAVSFLFRNAPLKQVIKGVRHLMKEVQKNPNEEKITGVGALLAYTVRGAKGGLHSKAPELLQLMLDRTTLNGGVTMAVEGTPQKDAAANAAVSVAVVAEAIERVCQNTTREKSGVLWECLLEEVNGLLEKVSDRVKDDPVRVTDGVSAGSDVPEGADWGRARDDLARALHLLNNAVEHHRGSRVLDYRPLFALAQSLLRPPVFQEIEDGSTTELRPGVGMDVEETPTLQKETLRLLLALIASHERIAGASQGPSSVARAAATWQPAFESSNAENLIPFLQALLSPSRAYSLPFFAHSMLTSLDRLIGGHPTAVLPLLLATCRRIEPTPLANPLLLNQSGGGGGDRKNQNLVQNLLSAVAGYTAAEGQGLAEVWAAVRLLPYAESDADAGADKVWGLVQSVRAQLEESDEADVERQQSHAQASTSSSPADASLPQPSKPSGKATAQLEALLGAALEVHTAFVQRSKQGSLVKHTEAYLELARRAHCSPQVMTAVADFLGIVRGSPKHLSKARPLLSQDEGLAFIDLLHPNLRSPAKQLRIATLRVLGAFDPLTSPVSEREETQSGKVGKKRKMEEHSAGEPYLLFQQLLEIETAPLNLEDCRHSSSIITRLRVHAAADRLPAAYHKPLAQAMLGVLRIRFSLLWDAARETLAALLQKEEEARGRQGVKEPLVVWPAVLADLQETQAAWLRGEGSGRGPPAESDEEDGGEAVQDLETSFEAAASPLLDGTDLPTVTGLLLKSLQQAPHVAEAHSRHVVPLLLDFAQIPKGKTFAHGVPSKAGETGGEDEDELGSENSGSGIVWGSKAWREGLKHWLALLEEMRNARSLFRQAEVKDLLTSRLLLDSDPAVQQAALACLLNWKDPDLIPYAENLQRLVAHKTARDEITHWDIGPDGGVVLAEHRGALMRVVIHIMYPKLKKKATKQTSKATAGVPRAAVLGFLARMSPRELAPFFKLLLQPLSPAFRTGPPVSTVGASQNEPASKTWEEELESGVGPSFLERVDPDKLAAVPYKRRVGFLHMARELIDSWGEALLGPYLHGLLGVTVRILESSGRNGGVEDGAIRGGVETAGENGGAVDGVDGGREAETGGEVPAAALVGVESAEALEAGLEETVEKDGGQNRETNEESGKLDDQGAGSSAHPAGGNDKDLRSLSLRVLSSVLSRFPTLVAPIPETLEAKTLNLESRNVSTAAPPSYWALFFAAMAGPIARIRNDSASSDKASALLTCFLAMSRHPALAPLLAFDPNLVPGLMSVLSVPGASQGVIGTVLTIVESLLEMDSEGGVTSEEQLLLPHLPLLLTNLQQLLTLQRDHPGAGKTRKPSFRRELAILVTVSRHVTGGDAAAQLTSALMPLLRSPGGKRKIDEEACAAALKVLEGLGGVLEPESVAQNVPILAPLFISLQSREARKALSGALEGLAGAGRGLPDVGAKSTAAPMQLTEGSAVQPVEVRVTHGYAAGSSGVKSGLARVAGLLSDLNAMDPLTVDECDYGRRLDAYGKLEGGEFEKMTRLEAQLVLGQCLHDMQEEDLSLRSSAAHAIEVFVRFAATVLASVPEAAGTGAHEGPGAADADVGSADADVMEEDDDVQGADVSGKDADVSGVNASDVGAEVEAKVAGAGVRESGAAGGLEENGPLDGPGAVALITRLLLPHVRKGLASESLVVRREYVLLFREMIARLPGVPSLAGLRSLLSDDLEADVFHNIVHLQVHRRIRAMGRFRALCDQGHFHQGSLMTIFVPLFSQSLFEAKGDKEGNLVEAAVAAIATMSSQLEWGTYYGLLMRLFKLTSGKGVPHQRAIVRAICGVLERFHFFVEGEEGPNEERFVGTVLGENEGVGGNDGKAAEGSVARVGVIVGTDAQTGGQTAKSEGMANGGQKRSEGDLGAGGESSGGHADEANGKPEIARTEPERPGTATPEITAVKSAGGRLVPGTIQALLLKRVFPELRKSMIEEPDKKGDDGLVSTPVTLALVQVLALLPPRAMEVELPRLLHEVANLLKSRAQWVRDAARGAIVAAAQALGARYLHFIVETLSSSLTRGYQVHVLGYTLHAVLVKTLPLVKSGEIDYCLGGMTPIIEEDILGETGEEKDVEGLAKKMKETRHTMSYESLRLLAQAGGFAAVCRELVGVVRANLPRSLNPKIKGKLDEMLRNIASGLIQNPATGGLEVLVLTHGLVEDGLTWEADQAASKRKKKDDKQARSTGGNLKTVLDKVGISLGKREALEGPAEEPTVPNQQMLMEFGLQLMHSCFKRNKINGSDPKLAPLLNPMVELLNRCLDSRHDSVLTLAMKNLGYLVRTPLTAIRTSEPEIADRLFGIVRRSGRAASPLLQESLKLLTTLLRYGKEAKFSEAQLRIILTAPVFIDLEEGTTRATAFGLLKAIVGRKLVVPEMYDLMIRVGQLMVRSQDTTVRTLCSQTLLQFFLDFPLGQRRLQQHLEFLAANLAYEHPSGREAALEMIHAVLVKFPPEIVDENGDFFFLPLVTRLVNDDNQQCRAMVGSVLKVLMGRVGSAARQRMIEFAMAWYGGERRELWRPAAQVLGFGVEVLGPAFKRHVAAWRAAALAMLDRCQEALEGSPEAAGGEGSPSEDGQPAAPMWQEAYFTLTSAEKLFQKLPELVLSAQFQAFWEHVSSLLLHRHLWVRKAAGRLLGGLFAALPQPTRDPPGWAAGTVLFPPEGLQHVAASLCQQLEAEVVDDKLAEQGVKNLVYVATAMHAVLEAGVKPGVNGRPNGEHVGNGLGNGLAIGAEEDLEAGEADEVEEGSEEGRWQRERCPTLKSLFRRIARIALRVEPIQSAAALRWFAAVATALGGAAVRPHLPELVVPLYRLAEGNAAKTVPDDLKALAEEVMGLVRDSVGVSDFVSAYNVVRQDVKVSRDDRKRKAAIAALVDPERVAKKKIATGQKRQAQKKRKIEEHRRSDGRARR